jgi:hypothetical protein
MSFSQFQLRLLSEQMLRYDPCNDLYASDNKFRRSSQLHKIRRKGSKDFSAEEFPETRVTLTNLRAAGKRICSMNEHAQEHFNTIMKKTNAGPCEVCGLPTYWMCMTCEKYMCLLNKRHWNGASVHFCSTVKSSSGWQGATILMCLERAGRRERKKGRNWIVGSQLLTLPWRDTNASSHGSMHRMRMKRVQLPAGARNFIRCCV